MVRVCGKKGGENIGEAEGSNSIATKTAIFVGEIEREREGER